MWYVRLPLIGLGVLVALMGLLWIGQGSGYFPYPASSFMINQMPWLYRGVAMLVGGLVLVGIGRRF